MKKTFAFAAPLLLGLSMPAIAQFRASPQRGSSSIAVEAKPAPAPVVVTSPLAGHPHAFPRRVVAHTLLPALVLSDGSIFADFGMGFEPVARPCAGFALVAPTQRVRLGVRSNTVVTSGAPTYTQPVPNQQTASQQLLPSAQASRRPISPAAHNACFAHDAAGRPVVVVR